MDRNDDPATLDRQIREAELEHQDAVSQRTQLDQRMKEMGKQRGHLSSKIEDLRTRITKMKSQAYDALKASQHSTRPADHTLGSTEHQHGTNTAGSGAQKSKRKRKQREGPRSSSAADLDEPEDSDVVEVVPQPVKREPSPIRVWAHNWPELGRQHKKAKIETTLAYTTESRNATPGPSSGHIHHSTPTVIHPGANRETGSSRNDVVIHRLKWSSSSRNDIIEAIQEFHGNHDEQLTSFSNIQVQSVAPIIRPHLDPIGRRLAVRVPILHADLSNLLIEHGITITGVSYKVSKYQHRSSGDRSARRRPQSPSALS